MRPLHSFLLSTLALLPLTAPADEKPSAILSSEFIYEEAPFPSCHASTIAETPEGMVAAWFGGTAEGKPDVSIYVSRQVDKKWGAPVLVADGVQADGTTRFPCWNPVLIQPKAGILMLFYKVGASPQKWWGEFRTSSDHGKTWSAATLLPEGILGPIKNKPVILENGDLLCPTSIETATAPSDWRVHFERTTDHGKTWSATAPAPVADGMKEINAIQPSILFHGGNKLQSLGRSRSGKLFETWSEDGGQTWAPLTLMSLPNPNSGTDAVTLKDGRHLLIYNPVPKGRSPLCIAVSKDGKTWEAALEIENTPKAEFSYPAIIQTSDGLVHITYTWKRQKIRHAVIDPAKLSPRPLVNGEWPK